jgi:hypothetical protein
VANDHNVRKRELEGWRRRLERTLNPSAQRRVKRLRADRTAGNTMMCPRSPLERIVGRGHLTELKSFPSRARLL